MICDAMFMTNIPSSRLAHNVLWYIKRFNLEMNGKMLLYTEKINIFSYDKHSNFTITKITTHPPKFTSSPVDLFFYMLHNLKRPAVWQSLKLVYFNQSSDLVIQLVCSEREPVCVQPLEAWRSVLLHLTWFSKLTSVRPLIFRYPHKYESSIVTCWPTQTD